MKPLILSVLVTGLTFGQEGPQQAESSAAGKTPALVNSGKPMKTTVSCGAEQIERLGLTCSLEEPCPVYLELAAADSAGDRLFVSGNLHTSSSTVSSILLASEDGGKTWTEPFERIPSAALDQIQFLDLENGWVAGQVAGALPRDPFFLITTNGGKSWIRRPIFSETRVGTVDHFWFDSRTAGTMTVDRTQAGESGARHELYESMTGGESWMMREVSSKPIALKRGRAPGSALWRVRADASSKSYLLEKQGSNQWIPVAAFLIAAGECKPEEGQLTEPAPAPEAEPKPSGEFRIGGTPEEPRDSPSLKKKKKR